jgi:metallo-beta-lactamase family protein
VKIEFVGAARTVTGSSYIIKNDDFTVMVDCGMFQGKRELRERNHLNLIYAPPEIDALLVTHAHIDHSGLIPKLVKEGFSGPIFATKATVDLLTVMLPDSAHIQEMDTVWINKRNKKLGRPSVDPLYVQDDAHAAIHKLTSTAYGQVFDVVPGVQARFNDAGHILGSASLEMWVTENEKTTKFIFSGDQGPKDQAIIRNSQQIVDADYLLIESTYGDRLHKSKPDTYAEFRDIINQTYNKKGNIVIPSFAVERTQEIIYTLAQLFRAGEIPKIPVYIDSPLAISATEIFRENTQCFDDETRKLLESGQTPLDFPNLTFVRSTAESKKLNEKAKGAIIISASGMCTAGRIKYHLQNNLYKPDSSVLFVGYQAEGTLGRSLVEGAKRVRVYGEDVVVNAKIYTLGGFSGHADHDGLLEWMGSIKNEKLKVFVVHGWRRGRARRDFFKLCG